VPGPNYFDVRRFRAEVPLHFSGYPAIVGRDEYIRERLRNCQAVLEIGAGDRPFFGNGAPSTYRTMDIDHCLKLDFYSIEEVTGTYDAVLMREVVEHLPREMFYDYLRKIYSVLAPGGTLFLTTPNTWCPSWMLADYTHISHWPMHDMYAVLKCSGFEPVQIKRILWPSKWLFAKKACWYFISKLYPFDYAGSYLAIAMKPLTVRNSS